MDIGHNLHLSANKQEIVAKVNKLGFFLPPILKLLGDKRNANNDKAGPQPHFTLIGQDTFLRFQHGNKLLADTLLVSWDGQQLVARLDQGQGVMNFTAKGEKFSLKGDNFGAPFLSALLNESRFNGGSFSLLAGGDFHNYDLAFAIKDSHVKNFTLINNIMAFIDTVPSLLSFSLPGYTVQGMDIVSAEGALTMVDNKIKVKSFSLQSSTLTITATGTVDLGQKNLDLLLNIISPAPNNLAKIPLAGWLFKGTRKMLAVTLAMTGPIDEPEISSTMFKGIPAKGFKFIKQTLHLPLDIADDVFPTEGGGKWLNE